MNNNEYDHVLEIVVDNAKNMISEDERIKEDEDKFHDILFGRVLTEIDNSAWSYLEAREISEVCGEVESDIINGDILGL